MGARWFALLVIVAGTVVVAASAKRPRASGDSDGGSLEVPVSPGAGGIGPEEVRDHLRAEAAAQALGCLDQPGDKRLQVAVGVNGCFGGSESTVALVFHSDRWTLESHEWADLGQHRVYGPSEVPASEARRIIQRLLAALHQQPTHSECISTSKTFGQIYLACAGGEADPMLFTTNACGVDMSVDSTGHLTESPSTDYAIGLGLDAWATEVFAAHRNAPVLPDSAEELARFRSKWGSLYDGGLRVRHDPLDE